MKRSKSKGKVYFGIWSSEWSWRDAMSSFSSLSLWNTVVMWQCPWKESYRHCQTWIGKKLFSQDLSIRFIVEVVKTFCTRMPEIVTSLLTSLDSFLLPRVRSSLEEFMDSATLDFMGCTLLNSSRDFLWSLELLRLLYVGSRSTHRIGVYFATRRTTLNAR